MGLIYVIRSGETNYYKIGVCEGVLQQRLTALQCGNPEKLTVIHTVKVKDPYAIEHRIHKYLEHLHYSGEWYDLYDSNIAITAIRACSELPETKKITTEYVFMYHSKPYKAKDIYKFAETHSIPEDKIKDLVRGKIKRFGAWRYIPSE